MMLEASKKQGCHLRETGNRIEDTGIYSQKTGLTHPMVSASRVPRLVIIFWIVNKKLQLFFDNRIIII